MVKDASDAGRSQKPREIFIDRDRLEWTCPQCGVFYVRVLDSDPKWAWERLGSVVRSHIESCQGPIESSLGKVLKWARKRRV